MYIYIQGRRAKFDTVRFYPCIENHLGQVAETLTQHSRIIYSTFPGFTDLLEKFKQPDSWKQITAIMMICAGLKDSNILKRAA